MNCPKCGKEIAAGSEFCQFCGRKIEAEKPKKEVATGEPSPKQITPVMIVLFVVIGVLVISNLYFFLTAGKDGGSPIIPGSSGSAKCDPTEKIKAEMFDEMSAFIISKDAGKASSKFFASEKVVILNKNTYDRSFNATMKYYKPAKMYWSWDDSIADVTTTKFKGFTAKMTITPKTTGAFYVTFTNSKNNQEFKVLVIIVD